MRITGTETFGPLYAVTPQGRYAYSINGQPQQFIGDVAPHHPSGFATDFSGNFLMTIRGEYLPIAQLRTDLAREHAPAPHVSPAPTDTAHSAIENAQPDTVHDETPHSAEEHTPKHDIPRIRIVTPQGEWLLDDNNDYIYFQGTPQQLEGTEYACDSEGNYLVSDDDEYLLYEEAQDLLSDNTDTSEPAAESHGNDTTPSATTPAHHEPTPTPPHAVTPPPAVTPPMNIAPPPPATMPPAGVVPPTSALPPATPLPPNTTLASPVMPPPALTQPHTGTKHDNKKLLLTILLLIALFLALGAIVGILLSSLLSAPSNVNHPQPTSLAAITHHTTSSVHHTIATTLDTPIPTPTHNAVQ